VKHHYADNATRSIVSLHPAPNNATQWWITRVSVLSPHRGQGIAGLLLDRVCADADAEGVTLWLHVSPDLSEGELLEEPRPKALDFEQLVKFYARRGFEENYELPGEMRRLPR